MKSLYESLYEYINESLLLEADNSWGEIFESIIIEAWNSKGESLGEYDKVARGKGLDPAELSKNIYNSLLDSGFIKKGDNLSKLANVPNTTKEWYDLGMYTKKPNTTPKTDIISASKACRISVKEESGARLMSGGVNETIATLRVAIRESGDKELQDFAENIFNNLQGANTRGRIQGTTDDILKKLKLRENPNDEPEDESERIIWKIEQAKYQLAALIEKIKTFPSVYQALLKEAITGNVKFGENNEAAANYVLTWDKNGKCELYDVDDYIKKFGNQYKIYATYKSSSVKVRGVKTGARDTWMVMTLSN